MRIFILFISAVTFLISGMQAMALIAADLAVAIRRVMHRKRLDDLIHRVLPASD